MNISKKISLAFFLVTLSLGAASEEQLTILRTVENNNKTVLTDDIVEILVKAEEMLIADEIAKLQAYIAANPWIIEHIQALFSTLINAQNEAAVNNEINK